MKYVVFLVLMSSLVVGLEFQEYAVDEYFDNPHGKGLADIDGDGNLDLVVGGAQSPGGIAWYRFNSWDDWDRKIVDEPTGYTTSLATGDMDGDGDIDIIAPNGNNNGVHVWWFENPMPGGDPLIDDWTKHDIAQASSHDCFVGDLDQDGDLEVVTQPDLTVHYREGSTWLKKTLDTSSNEGTSIGDLDGDGDLDIAIGGIWYEMPGTISGTWQSHTYASDISKGLKSATSINDINQDGRNDIIITPADYADNKQLRLYLAPSDPKNGQWTRVIVFENSDGRMHGTTSADFDNDGDIDIATAEMEQTSAHRVMVFLNDGDSTSFTKMDVATMGSHWLHSGDIDNDGDVDLYGVNHGNNGGDVNVYVWENLVGGGIGQWERHVLDDDKPWRAVFITSEDIDGDGLNDVVTGGWWYKNPGSPSGTWTRNTIGTPLRNMAVVHDFDSDGDMDVLGTEGQGSSSNDNFVWARNDGSGSFTILDNIENGDGDFLQGAAVDGNRVYLSWHQGNKGIQQLEIPDNPSTGTWSYSRISTTSQDEDLSLGDIGNDGDIDILMGTKWLEQTGGWWNSNYGKRTAFQVTSSGYIEVDFSTAAGTNSVRIVDSQNQEIPSQFEEDRDTIVFKGTPGDYYVYFDDGSKTAPSYPDTISTGSVMDEGQDSFRIATMTATYYFHKSGGGFSSIVDIDGNDWINHHATGGSSGDYRGIPNLAYPEGSMHPGSTDCTSQMTHDGPIRVVINTICTGGWETNWYIYPEYAELEVVATGHNYWFLYEGTPGGEFDTSDFVVRSDGTQDMVDDTWSGDISGNEWAFFVDPADGRALYVANLENDNIVDSYRDMDNAMTVFGFGRSGTSSMMTATPARFAIGLIDETVYAQARIQIENLYGNRQTSTGSIESHGASTWTEHTLNSASGMPDRNELADIDGDGRLDSIVGYEAISSTGKLAWYEQQSNPLNTWSEHIIANIVGPMSVDVADMDGDGDIDVVAGEHNLQNPSAARLFVFQNDGGSWTESIVYEGDEHHDGSQVVDIDNDGDMDIISIGWSHGRVVLYEQKGGQAASCPDQRCTGEETCLTCPQDCGSCSECPDQSCNGQETCATCPQDCGVCTMCNDGAINSQCRCGNDIQASGYCCEGSWQDTVCNTGSDSPILFFSFDNLGTMLADECNSGTQGVISGASYTEGVSETGLEFDGSNDYVNLGSMNVGGSQLTIAAWVNSADLDNCGTGDCRIISKASGSQEQDHDFMLSTIRSSGHKLRFRLKAGGSTSTLIGSQSLNTNTWVHVTGIYDGSQMRLYQDGQLVGSLAKSGTMSTSSNQVWIAANPSSSHYWDGMIDEVVIYNRVLSSAEIQNLVDNQPKHCSCTSFNNLIELIVDWKQGNKTLTEIFNGVLGWMGGC